MIGCDTVICRCRGHTVQQAFAVLVEDLVAVDVEVRDPLGLESQVRREVGQIGSLVCPKADFHQLRLHCGLRSQCLFVDPSILDTPRSGKRESLGLNCGCTRRPWVSLVDLCRAWDPQVLPRRSPALWRFQAITPRRSQAMLLRCLHQSPPQIKGHPESYYRCCNSTTMPSVRTWGLHSSRMVVTRRPLT